MVACTVTPSLLPAGQVPPFLATLARLADVIPIDFLATGAFLNLALRRNPEIAATVPLEPTSMEVTIRPADAGVVKFTFAVSVSHRDRVHGVVVASGTSRAELGRL